MRGADGKTYLHVHAPGACICADTGVRIDWDLEVPVGTLVVFDGDVPHQGLGYEGDHVGMHSYQDSQHGPQRVRQLDAPGSFCFVTGFDR